MATAYTEHALSAEYFFSWRGMGDDALVSACRPYLGAVGQVAVTLIAVGLVLVAARVRPRRAIGAASRAVAAPLNLV